MKNKKHNSSFLILNSAFPGEPEYGLCNRCGETKPLNSDNFPRDSKARYGFYLQCKICKAKAARKRYVTRHPDAKRVQRKKIIKKVRPERRVPRIEFDDLALQRKARDLLRPAISIDTESCKLFGN